jgi:alkanesulfonate monooxygenase SsuD/methylene tetrahydromethanopterin reductase-like flavin-dependent oxidoreductase (luciferase family)
MSERDEVDDCQCEQPWHARNDPLPLQGSNLPIWLGVQGEAVGLRIAAELADGWNFSGVGTLADFRRKRDTLRRFAETAGRDASTVEVSAQIKVDPDDRDSLERCLAFARAGCEHLILYVDPRVGPAGLNRLADRVVAPLRDVRV